MDLDDQIELKRLEKYMEAIDDSTVKLAENWGPPIYRGGDVDPQWLDIEISRCEALVHILGLKKLLIQENIKLKKGEKKCTMPTKLPGC